MDNLPTGRNMPIPGGRITPTRDNPIEPTGKRIPFESLPLDARHVLLQCGTWLLNDLGSRLGTAVRSGALRYNHLLRDFEEAPAWYRDVVKTDVPHRQTLISV